MQIHKKITRKDIASGLQMLLRLIAVYKREISIFMILSIILAVGNALIPYVVGIFIDSLVTPSLQFSLFGKTVPLYVAALSLWAGIQLVIVFVDRYISRNSDSLGGKVWTDYILQNINHLLRLPLSFHKKNKIGEVFDKINLTANNIESITSSIVIQLSPQLLSVTIAIYITFLINTLLGYFLLFSILIFLVIFIYGIAPLAELQRQSFLKSSRIWGNIYDNISNTRQIKEAVAEDVIFKESEHGLKTVLLEIWSQKFKTQGSLLFYQRSIVFFAQLFIFIYSISAILKGVMTIGELLAINGYAQMVFGPFVIIGRNWQNIQNGVININETEKVLQMPEEKYVPDTQVPLETLHGKVSFKNVDFYYDQEKPILSDITFDVQQGETVALVGESGVGKSTLVDLLLAFHFPKNGSLEIDGVAIQHINLTTLRKNIAVVSQDIVLFNDTIFKNIAFSKPGASKEEVELAAKTAHAYDFIEKFPNTWEQVVGERGIKLSGGQRQRVALARAILADPSILILDEPTSALDARSERYIQESLKNVMEGKTTFIIAHRFSMVRNANKIVVLKYGRIVEIGTHEELLAIENGEYRHLYELQVGHHS